MKLIDLARGWPAPSLLPRAAMSRAFEEASRALARGELSCGYTPPRGPEGFADELAAFLNRQCGGAAPPPAHVAARAEALHATGGTSHSLDLAAAAFGAAPGDVVLMTSPTYFLAADIFRSRGLELARAPTCARSGALDVGALARRLERPPGERTRGGGARRPRSLLYVVPAHANPSGASLIHGARRDLVELARLHDMPVIADEVYHLLDGYDGARTCGTRAARMVCFDPAFRAAAADEPPIVASCSSFTKIFAPGARLGWIEAAPALISRVASHGYVRSGGGVAPVAAHAMRCALAARDVDAALESLRTEYAKRARALVDALRAECVADNGSTPLLEFAGLDGDARPTGGYFVWARLREGGDSGALLAHAQSHGVAFLPGAACDPHAPSNASTPWFRLCFAYVSYDELHEGAARLGPAIRSYSAAQGPQLPTAT